jgi:hypothetical protein
VSAVRGVVRAKGRRAGVLSRVPAGRLIVALVVVLSAWPSTSANADLVPAPPLFIKTFHGTVHVVLREGTWVGDNGYFDGWETTGTFSGLVFADGADGVHTLLHSKSTFVPFRITQTVHGLHATCKATYLFSEASQGLTGDIGGFSETGGVYSATLDLGISTSGKVISSSNCGPYLEATGHPFGEPARLDIPVQASGIYKGGVLSLRSTSTQLIAGGELEIELFGTLT